ncbi:MAG: 30S ribosomal protein S8 [Acidimicrobiia bacterium]
MMSDPIADMLTRIRNAVAVGKPTVAMPSSQMKEGIAQILAAEGFIDGFEVEAGAGPQRTLILRLRYGAKRMPAIQGLSRVSRPGHRVYRGAGEMPRIQGGMGTAVVSTSQGLLTDREARRRRLGGEIVCEVW